MKQDLTTSFKKVYEVLINDGVGRTEFAKGIGFKSTTQLEKSLTGEAILSTKAIIGLIGKYEVNPNYLFLGEDDMFISEENSVNTLKAKIRDLEHNNNEALKTVKGLYGEIKKMEKRYYDLVDITSTAMKFHNQKDTEVTDNEDQDTRSE